jgi:hypothetical protein
LTLPYLITTIPMGADSWAVTTSSVPEGRHESDDLTTQPQDHISTWNLFQYDRARMQASTKMEIVWLSSWERGGPANTRLVSNVFPICYYIRRDATSALVVVLDCLKPF